MSSAPEIINDGYEVVPIGSLQPHPHNARHSDEDALSESLDALGFYGALLVERPSGRRKRGRIVAGEHRWRRMRDEGATEIPVIWIDPDDDRALRILLADNRTTDRSAALGYDRPKLAEALGILRDRDVIEGTGYERETVDRIIDEATARRALPGGSTDSEPDAPAPLDPVDIDRARRTLAERFIVPPFSVLNARAGYWQERKRAWLSLGIQSEVGRAANLLGRSPEEFATFSSGLPYRAAKALDRAGWLDGSRDRAALEAEYGAALSDVELERIVDRIPAYEAALLAARRGSGATPQSLSGAVPDFYYRKEAREAELGRELSTAEFEQMLVDEGGLDADSELWTGAGTSVFDPVVCELAYRWFSPPGGRVLDPFAGGSVRGIVAALLGRDYVGIDLRDEQVEANRAQAERILPSVSAVSPRPLRICLASLRQGLRSGPDVGCIQDAFLAVLGEILSDAGIEPLLYNVDLAGGRPRRDEQALADADVVLLFSSNEFTQHRSSGVVNPMHLEQSNARIAEHAPALAGKRIVVLSMDQMDTVELLLERCLSGIPDLDVSLISEQDFPTSIQSVRYGQMEDMIDSLDERPVRDLDLAYWGTTKRRDGNGEASGDVRYEMLRETLRDDELQTMLVGNHFGSRKADRKFDTNLRAIVPDLLRARATCCFQWPGHGQAITARYHEALALGLIPFAHVDYDSGDQLGIDPWQRISSAEELRARLLEIRDVDVYEARLAQIRAAYGERRPSDEEQTTRMRDLLAEQGVDLGPTVERPAWQHGYELEDLRAVASMFAEHDGDLIRGAFTKAKEVHVAQWLADGDLLVWQDAGRPVAAAHVSGGSKRPSPVRDFSGTLRCSIPASALRIRRVACLPGAEEALLAGLRAWRAAEPDAPLWAELWQEHPTDRGIAAALGLDLQAVKIRASSEIIGVYASQPPADSVEALQEEQLGLCRLDLRPLPTEALLDALDSLSPEFADHYSGYNVGHSWQALSLRGYAPDGDEADPAFIVKPDEMSKGWKAEHPETLGWQIADSPLRAALPQVEAILSEIPGVHHRIRIMRLAAGGELTRHADITDHLAGVSDGMLLRIHVPLRTNPQVVFHSWTPDGAELSCSMDVGTVWYLDTRKPHRARNDGDVDRLHLVVDVEATPELRELLVEPAPTIEQPQTVTIGPSDPLPPWQPGDSADLGLASDVGDASWIAGDSVDLPTLLDGEPPVDLLFTCPPYYDLERYSEDERDLSNLDDYEAFLAAYGEILQHGADLLADDRFAVIVVGEVRDRAGMNRGLIRDTIVACEAAGLQFYNEAILVSPTGSLALRTARIFNGARKLARAHQHVLVFVKGDPGRADAACGPVEIAEVSL